MSAFSSIADALECDWASKARSEQLPPPGNWTTWLVLAGRGWGKTRCGAELGQIPRRGRQRGSHCPCGANGCGLSGYDG
jgi:phage terminase large subunit-like protein